LLQRSAVTSINMIWIYLIQPEKIIRKIVFPIVLFKTWQYPHSSILAWSWFLSGLMSAVTKDPDRELHAYMSKSNRVARSMHIHWWMNSVSNWIMPRMCCLLTAACMHVLECWNVPVPYHGTVVLVPIACDVLTLKISSLQAFRIHHPSDLSPSTVADKAMATYISLCFSLSLVKQYQAIGGTNYFFAKCINRKGSFYKFTSLRRGNTHPIQLNPLDLSNNGDHGP
jgi:hypothetical protein